MSVMVSEIVAAGLNAGNRMNCSAVGSGSEYVRFAPWFPYPRVVVTELEPPDCTATKPATNWNSTLFDGVMRDFMRCASFCQKEGP